MMASAPLTVQHAGLLEPLAALQSASMKENRFSSERSGGPANRPVRGNLILAEELHRHRT
jgi:hypothetical protein